MAKTESVKMLVEAENTASAELKRVQLDIKKTVGSVKEVGGQAKASTELVGSLATQLGGLGIGGVAGDVAMLTERVSAFSEVMNTGTKGVTLFKVGLASATAVIAVQAGKALGDLIFKTKQWTRALGESQAMYEELAGKLNNTVNAKLSDQVDLAIRLADEQKDSNKLLEVRARLVTEIAGKERELRTARRMRNRLLELPYWTTRAQALFDEANSRIRIAKASKEELETLNIKVSKEGLIDRARLARLEEQSKSMEVLRDLQLQAAIATAKSEDEKLRIQLRAKGVRENELDLAVQLSKQVEKMAKTEQFYKDEKARKQRQEKENLRSMIKADQERLSLLREQESEIKKGNRTTRTGPLSAGQSQRLLTGRTGNEFRKSAETIELERQTKIHKELKKNAAEQTRVLKAIERKQQQIEVIGT